MIGPETLVLLVLLTGTANALDKAVPQQAAQIQLSFAPAVRAAAPAVVNIYTREDTGPGTTSTLKSSLAFQKLLSEDSGESTPLGSGVLVDGSGTIVTNEHVIHGVGGLTVVLYDRRQFEARVVRTDERNDLAVLRIDAGGQALPFIQIRDSDELEVGDLVLAIGNPFGVGQTVTMGIVSALARTVTAVSDSRTFIQTDASINPGNSGGALVSLDGELVGINTALYSEGGGSVGIGFAIPTVLVRAILSQNGASDHIAHPWLGARGRSVDTWVAQRLGLPRVAGMLVEDVVDGGPCAIAGLVPGDVIVSVDGKPVDDVEALRFRFATLLVGSTAHLGIVRHGEPSEVAIRLVAPPEVPKRNVTQLTAAPLAGATVANLSPALADELQTDQTRGIIVLYVPRGSAAAHLKIQVSDIIRQVDREPVATVAELQAALERAGPGAKMTLQRDDHRFQVSTPP